MLATSIGQISDTPPRNTKRYSFPCLHSLSPPQTPNSRKNTKKLNEARLQQPVEAIPLHLPWALAGPLPHPHPEF